MFVLFIIISGTLSFPIGLIAGAIRPFRAVVELLFQIDRLPSRLVAASYAVNETLA